MRSFAYEHTVSLDESNVYGSVYFTHYLRWQGLCRESFLRKYVPEIVSPQSDIVLATVHASCDYLREVVPFDRVRVQMSLDDLRQNRITMSFEYWRLAAAERVLVGRGQQQIASLQRKDERLEACPVPEALVRALEPYQEASVPAWARVIPNTSLAGVSR